MRINDKSWCFKTSVKDNHQGWHHFADAYEVMALKGIWLGYSKIPHPHINGQPFTR